MRKPQIHSELARAINRRAHALMGESFDAIRRQLTREALEQLKAGSTREQVAASLATASLDMGVTVATRPATAAQTGGNLAH